MQRFPLQQCSHQKLDENIAFIIKMKGRDDYFLTTLKDVCLPLEETSM